MDRDTEREIERLNRRLDEVDETQKEQGKAITDLAKAILRFWHLGVGISLGFVIKELGVEKLLGHFI